MVAFPSISSKPVLATCKPLATDLMAKSYSRMPLHTFALRPITELRPQSTSDKHRHTIPNTLVTSNTIMQNIAPKLKICDEVTLHDLARHALFAGWSDAGRVALLRASQLVSLAEGDLVFRQGQRDDNMYFVKSGKVAMSWGEEENAAPHSPRPSTKERRMSGPVGTRRLMQVLSAGDVLGERAVFFSEAQEATALALTPCELFRLSKQSVIDAMFQTPGGFLDSKNYVNEESAQHLAPLPLGAVLQNPVLSAALSKEVLRELHSALTPVVFGAGEHVTRSGAAATACLFLQHGVAKDRELEVTPGHAVGALELLLDGSRWKRNLRAVTRCSGWSLSQEAFHAILRRHRDVGRVLHSAEFQMSLAKSVEL